MIDVVLPRVRLVELSWVIDILFTRFWRLPCRITAWDGADVEFRHQGRTLSIKSTFPNLLPEVSLNSTEVPEQPAGTIALARLARMSDFPFESDVPFIFGVPTISHTNERIEFGPDILGSIFFILSRFEEVARTDRDIHDRFPGAASLSYRAGMVQRPWVDELAELLFSLMYCLWPGLPRRLASGSVIVSCDVDHPYDASASDPALLMRTMAADIVLKRQPALAWARFCNALASATGSTRYDPYDTFDWYLAALDQAGRKASFYFIADHTAGHIDGRYDIFERRVAQIFQKVAGNGHEIGTHGSYNSFLNGPQLARERDRLAEAVSKAGLHISIVGNRQHVLRWSALETPDHLDAAGFAYDTTGSFADLAGFRYGTSRAFPMWSWQKRAALRLEQLPLIVMETTVIAKRYMGLGYSPEAFDLMTRLRRECEKHGGNFTLLWHNSHLTTATDREFFEQLIQ